MELVRSAGHPTELWALLKFKYGGGREVVMPKIDQASLSPGMKRCYELLNQTSRSFAAVIQSLDDDLRPAICIFYLVLRALDTVEDDMKIPVAKKTAMLKEFHTHLHDTQWTFMDSSEEDKVVLEEFNVIAGEFLALDQKFRDVIEDICAKMGEGMTVFLESEVGSMQQWDEYCHYVAGLVGIGLSRLFSASGLEDDEVAKDEYLSNSMGLFLQKTNIIRDYLEDVQQGREFWPREAWSQFGESLSELQKCGSRDRAMQCMNLLITNALQHVPDVISYMSRIKNQSVFNFCAIPQTMAIATLCACYNNPKVFTGVVKIRKGQAVQLIMASTSMHNLRTILAHHTRQIARAIPASDPTSDETRAITTRILDLCSSNSHKLEEQSSIQVYLAGLVTVAAIAYVVWSSSAH